MKPCRTGRNAKNLPKILYAMEDSFELYGFLRFYCSELKVIDISLAYSFVAIWKWQPRLSPDLSNC